MTFCVINVIGNESFPFRNVLWKKVTFSQTQLSCFTPPLHMNHTYFLLWHVSHHPFYFNDFFKFRIYDIFSIIQYKIRIFPHVLTTCRTAWAIVQNFFKLAHWAGEVKVPLLNKAIKAQLWLKGINSWHRFAIRVFKWHQYIFCITNLSIIG